MHLSTKKTLLVFECTERKNRLNEYMVEQAGNSLICGENSRIEKEIRFFG